MYESPVATLMNDPKFSDLKQQTFVVLLLWKSEVQSWFHVAKIKVQSHVLLGGSRGRSALCLFQLLEAACFPWLMAPKPSDHCFCCNVFLCHGLF